MVRVPTIPAADGRTYLTYVNCLIDRQGDRRIVYLPFYRGAAALNVAALQNLGKTSALKSVRWIAPPPTGNSAACIAW